MQVIYFEIKRKVLLKFYYYMFTCNCNNKKNIFLTSIQTMTSVLMLKKIALLLLIYINFYVLYINFIMI